MSADDPTNLSNPTVKYSISRTTDAQHDTSVSSEWAWRHEHNNPRITTHCQERWDERTPSGSVSPETAWLHAVGVGTGVLDWFEDEGGQTPDEVRLYHGTTDAQPYSVVFIVCGTPSDDGEYHVRTVYRVHDVDDQRMRAYLAVVEWQAACMHGDDPACDTPTRPQYTTDVVPTGVVAALDTGGDA